MTNPIEPLVKTAYMIVRLEIVDGQGVEFSRPYVLNEGANRFKCRATYVDGSRTFYDPYWTCPVFYRGKEWLNLPTKVGLWDVLGRRRSFEVVIHASAKQECYTELACWVFPPDSGSSMDDRENPRDSTGFDYVNFPDL